MKIAALIPAYCPDEKLIAKVAQKLNLKEQSPFYTYYHNALTDSYKRLLLPSLERELRNELTEKAEKQAISVFAANLRQLLLTQPISGHTVLGLDPGYRTGCKTAVIDANGRILATTAMYITGSKNQQEQAEKQFVELMKKHKISLIAIGNGTASKESEIFIAGLLRDIIRQCQVFRKEAGFEVSDKIFVEFITDSAPAASVITDSREQLCHDLLAEITAVDAPDYTGNIDLDAVKITVKVKK